MPPLDRHRPPRTSPARAPTPPPGTLRDPWAWGTALAIVPLLAKCFGAPLGEPVAEDFDFLHRTFFRGMGSLLDGGGSQAFWRPLAHQVYYALLGPVMVAHPLAVAALHALLLAAGAVLLYRVFRLGFEGPVAAMMASFPLLSESTRTILGWPTQFVDLGMFLFSALALHEASRRRMPSALLALLAALLCKEVAVVTALLLPFLPGLGSRRERGRWAIATGTLLAAWAGLYLWVRHTAHLELPHGLEHQAGSLATPLPSRFGWALMSSLRAVFSRPIVPGPWDLPALLAVMALGVAAAALFVSSHAARARLAARRPWIAWGLAWFVVATATLTPIYPFWQPNRSQIGAVGLGAALTAGLASAHPGLATGLLVTRLALLAVSPVAAVSTSGEPPETGAFMDFARLTRLQHFMRESRKVLHASHPTLAHGANVVLVNMPHLAIYAFGGDLAIQAWYRDSSLHMPTFDVLHRQPDLPFVCALQYQPFERVEIVAIPAEALRVQEEAYAQLGAQHFAVALAALARADSLARDPRAVVFHAHNISMRAFALEITGNGDEAEREALHALAVYPHDYNARLVLAAEGLQHGHLDAADRQIDTLLADNPGQPAGLKLRDAIAAARAAGFTRRPAFPGRP